VPGQGGSGGISVRQQWQLSMSDTPEDPSMESAMDKVTDIAESHGLVFVGAFAKQHGPRVHIRLRVASPKKDGPAADMVRHCLDELQTMRTKTQEFLLLSKASS
jgi:hypothetical protein